MPDEWVLPHNNDADSWHVGDVIFVEGDLVHLRRFGQAASHNPVSAAAFAGLDPPAVGQRVYFAYRPSSPPLVRPYRPGAWSGGDDATFHLGTLTSWFPLGDSNRIVLDDGFTVFGAADFPFDKSAGIGRLTKDGDRVESTAVYASEFSFTPDCLVPVFYRYETLGGTTPQHSTRLDVDPGPAQYGGAPAAMVGCRYFFSISSAPTAAHPNGMPSMATNLRPVDPSAEPRG